ncbi:MAG: phage tail protein [Chitinophagaceae bacterium]|nr:phage tail protein [Chitinophagaceae bacterium]
MEGTLAEIRMFAGNFAPRGWQLCNGQLLSIAQWTAVFALVGTTYGGNGQTTFGLPDFRGRVAAGTGQGPGLPAYQLGEMAGTQNTSLILTNLPLHNHTLSGSVTMLANGGEDGLTDDPTGRRLAGANIYTNFTNEPATMSPPQSNLTTAVAGSNQPFSNRPPYLGINFIFCVEGIFPSRD